MLTWHGSSSEKGDGNRSHMSVAWLQRAEQPIVGPEDRASKAVPFDDDCTLQHVDPSFVSSGLPLASSDIIS